MMKRFNLQRILLSFLIASLFIFLFSSCVTVKPNDEPMEEYIAIIQVEGCLKNELWEKANAWCVDAFRNSKNVVHFSDKEAGVIRGKFTDEYNSYFYEYVQTTFSIEVKDEKARILFYDPLRIVFGDIMFGYYDSPDEVPLYKSDTNLVQQVYSDWQMLITGFNNKLTEKNISDW